MVPERSLLLHLYINSIYPILKFKCKLKGLKRQIKLIL
jgi:hypothetical protein